jgi:glycosyltransferase involved in cell wall biosynthesis
MLNLCLILQINFQSKNMKISVALCTYNGEKYLYEQLNSILNQTLKVNEIIVCDDQSTDSTIAILEDYSKKNEGLFKIFKNEINLRSVKNFEKAVSLCTGDIIFLSDQDDSWLPEKVAAIIRYFELNPNINVVATNGYCMDENSEILDRYTIWDVPEFLRQEKLDFDYYSLITEVGNFVTGASLAFRNKFLSQIMPFPIVKNFHHDEWIAIIACKNNAFEMLNEKYFLYRVHSGQQVGGVSYNKSKKAKKSLIENYNLKKLNSFIGFKRRLKKLHFNFYKNIDLANESIYYKNIFNENATLIKLNFQQTKLEFNQKYPLSSRLLTISDYILGKRKMK